MNLPFIRENTWLEDLGAECFEVGHFGQGGLELRIFEHSILEPHIFTSVGRQKLMRLVFRFEGSVFSSLTNWNLNFQA